MALPLGMHLFTLLGVAALGLGLLFDIIGVATPSWSAWDNSLGSYGLFQYCIADTCMSYPSGVFGSDLTVCQVFACTGVVEAGLALFSAIYFILLPKLGRQQTMKVPKGTLAMGFIACLVIIISAIVWAASILDYSTQSPGYSLALSLVGAVISPGGGILVFLGARKTVGYDTLPR